MIYPVGFIVMDVLDVLAEHVGFEERRPSTMVAETTLLELPTPSPWKAAPRSPSPEEIPLPWKINTTPRIR